MNKLSHHLKRLICRLRGHRYPGYSYAIDNYTLVFCKRCGKEMFDRTWDDILPLPDDYDRDWGVSNDH